MSDARLHLLAERLSSLMRSGLRQVAVENDLKLVQLEALIYLSVANRYSDTLLALTEYFGVTKGTTSQTLKALERRGLVTKWADPNDGRVQHCSLTEAGKRIAASAYPTDCFATLSRPSASSFADTLEQQLRTLQRAGGLKTFGQCHTCRHFKARSRGGQCGLTGEPLSKPETSQICREHALS